jgi:DNA-binding XRE family transcriptional regulator
LWWRSPLWFANSPTLELAFQISRNFGTGLDEVFHYPADAE